MDQVKLEYEFLDLSDINEEERSNLNCTLLTCNDGAYADLPTPSTLSPNYNGDLYTNPGQHHFGWTDPNYDLTSSSSGTPGPPTATSSLDSLSAGEGEMPPHSPARRGGGQPGPSGPSAGRPAAHGPPPPYAAPPPPYGQPWAVAPPNVYVGQVTANVNVHGYMGQYYRAPAQQPAYAPQPRDRRKLKPKRANSPPPHAAAHYLPYPGAYYPQHGAPLYHVPVYPQIGYMPYPYASYLEYPLVDEPAHRDKLAEDYPPEMLAEAEPHADAAYYAPAPYAHPLYEAPRDPNALEYPAYAPPHPHAHHQPISFRAHYAPPPAHQFNVHAKNFVRQSDCEKAAPAPIEAEAPEPPTPRREESPPVASASAAAVDALPLRDLSISAEPAASAEPIVVEAPAAALAPPVAPPAAAHAPPVASPVAAPEAVDAAAEPVVRVSVEEPPPTPARSADAPPKNAAPFASAKPIFESRPAEAPAPTPTPTPPPSVAPSRAPFPARPKREEAGGAKAATLPPPQVAGKAPFSHGRRAAPQPAAAPPAPAVEAPAPSAADFPPPPTPRPRADAPPAARPPLAPVAAAAAPAKSWASLFAPPAATALSPREETPTRRPVAKVGPFDASPVQPAQPPPASYSEKTSSAAGDAPPDADASPRRATDADDAPSADEPRVSAPLPVPSLFADDPNSYRMGEFLSKYQLDNRIVHLQPRGLTNQSNYCYVNAILQALIACPPFYNMLKSLPYQTRRGKSSTPIIDAMVELCYEFGAGTAAAGGAAGKRGAAGALGGALPPVPGAPLEGSCALRVLRAARPLAPDGAEARQEDAEEFLSCLLNGVNDEMLQLIKLVEPEEPKEAMFNGNVVQQEEFDEDSDDWKVMGPRNRGAVERPWGGSGWRCTPLSRIFRGRRRTRLQRCSAAPLYADTVEPFFTLQLEIEKSSSVKEALELIGGKDTIEGGSLENGSNGTTVTMHHQVSLDELPVVLLLHLKCFQLDPAAPTRPVKIVKPIDFPVELTIDPKIMSSKTKYQQKQRCYKLFAVVYHEGTEATKGHYVTDTAHASGCWVRYDDSTVTQVTEAQVLKSKPPRMPYLVMYRRKDTSGGGHRMQGKAD